MALQSQQEVINALASWNASSKDELASTMDSYYSVMIESTTQVHASHAFQRQLCQVPNLEHSGRGIWCLPVSLPALYHGVTKLDFTWRASKQSTHLPKQCAPFAVPLGKGRKHNIFREICCRYLSSAYMMVCSSRVLADTCCSLGKPVLVGSKSQGDVSRAGSWSKQLQPDWPTKFITELS